jgi:hypothetical protein
MIPLTVRDLRAAKIPVRNIMCSSSEALKQFNLKKNLTLISLNCRIIYLIETIEKAINFILITKSRGSIIDYFVGGPHMS